MGQVVGTLLGLITSFVIVFVILTLGSAIPADIISPSVVTDFLSRTDLELKLAIVSTVLYPPLLGIQFGMGAQSSTVLMALAWGTGGLIAGLAARNFIAGVIAALFAVILGAILTWLLFFLINTSDLSQLFGGLSLLILQYSLEGALYPAIAATIGGLMGGGITRTKA